jgi:hypothetical protein
MTPQEKALRALKDTYLAVHYQVTHCDDGSTNVDWEKYHRQLREALEALGEPVYPTKKWIHKVLKGEVKRPVVYTKER